MTDAAKKMMIRGLAETQVRLCLRAGYDASQKGLNVEMLVNTAGEAMSEAFSNSLLDALERLDR